MAEKTVGGKTYAEHYQYLVELRKKFDELLLGNDCSKNGLAKLTRMKEQYADQANLVATAFVRND